MTVTAKNVTSSINKLTGSIVLVTLVYIDVLIALHSGDSLFCCVKRSLTTDEHSITCVTESLSVP